MKFLKLSVAVIVLAIMVFFSCTRQSLNKQTGGGGALQTASNGGTKKIPLDAPALTCQSATAASITIKVCAGASGAPAGFSVQWMLKADYDLYGWSSGDLSSPSYCGASFSGVPGCSNYKLGPNACVSINLGENLFDACGASSSCLAQLLCGKEYVFRAFAHNDPVSGAGKSDLTATLTCSTLPCTDKGCTLTQGYWKTHGPAGCAAGNNSNTWPVTNMQLGTVNYTDLQICSILNTPAGGNGLLALAHQLIAAKLNIAAGADGSAVTQAIANADALIGGLVIPPAGSGSLSPASTGALITTLTSYNEGATGPGHCLTN